MRARGRTHVGAAALSVVVAVTLAAAPAATAAERSAVASSSPAPVVGEPVTTAVTYRPPVDGRVLQPFDPPATFAAAGHRGVDLDAVPGEAVLAAADGVVTFAGSVAGAGWVSLAHADRVITSYGPIVTDRRAGDEVGAGERLGRLAPGGHGEHGDDSGLHVSARLDGRYFDPLLLFGAPPRPSLVGAGGWGGTAHAIDGYDGWSGRRLGGLSTAPSPEATRPGYATPPNANHLVIVAGLATSSGSEVIDPADLGYDPESVTVFSYAGLLEEAGAPDDPYRVHAPYGPVDTWPGAAAVADAFDAVLRDVADRQPGRGVDVLAHSMGGLVTVEYLLDHHDPYDTATPPVANVVTYASPFRGSDLAAVGTAVLDTPLLGPLLRRVQALTGLGRGHLDLTAPAIGQLAVGSAALEDLAVRWETSWEAVDAEHPTGPLAFHPRLLTIGGATDAVVFADRAAQPHGPWHGPVGDRERTVAGGPVVTHRVLPGGHSGVLQTEAAREVAHDFLSGGEPVEAPGALTSGVGRVGGTLLRYGIEALDWVPALRWRTVGGSR